MKRGNDEFNFEKVTNEEGSDSFEFGSTPDSESASYNDNRDQIRDEVNDNPASNDENKQREKEKERKQEQRQQQQKSESNNSSESSGGEGGAASGGAASSVAAVGAAVIAVTALSSMVGINVFYNGKCHINHLEATEESIVYALELTDIGENECVVTIENHKISYKEQRELREGPNEGHFFNLTPATTYHFSVIDLTYQNFVLFSQDIKTPGDLPPTIEYSVIFETDGGSFVQTQYVLEGQCATRPEDPTKEGAEFTGWYIDNDLTEEYDFTTPVTQDTVLYAGWDEGTFYQIDFDTDGGSSVDSQTIREGNLVIQPEDPTKEGYRFIGWFSNNDLTEEYDFTTPVTESFTIWAGWEYIVTFQVTFETDGGTEIEPQTVEEGDTVTQPEDPTKEGYTFLGWFSDSDLTEEYDFNTPVEDDLILYASWHNDNIKTISFNANGGSGEMETIEIEKGGKFTIPDCTFTPPDDTQMFDRWHLNSPDGTIVPVGYELTVSRDLVFYATWKEDTRYTITIDSNGGTGSMDPIKTFGPEVEVPECTITPPENYRFDYWYVIDQVANSHYQPGDMLMVTSDLILAPSWAPDVEFSFHVDYIDTRSSETSSTSTGGASNTMRFYYTYIDDNNMYSSFSIVFSDDYGHSYRIPLSLETGEGNVGRGDLTDIYEIFNDDTIIYDYTVIGVTAYSDEYTVASGSLASKQSQKSYFSGVYVDGVKLEDNASINYIQSGSSAIIPMLFDMRDFANEVYGGNIAVECNIGDGTSGTSIYNYFGMITFELMEPENSFTIDHFTIYDANHNVIATYENITCSIYEGTPKIYGFNFFINDSAQAAYLRLIANADTFGDLGYTNYSFIIEATNSDGYVYEDNLSGNLVKYEEEFEPDESTSSLTQIEIPITNYAKFKSYVGRYIFNVSIRYYDPSEGYKTVQCYTNYTFEL